MSKNQLFYFWTQQVDYLIRLIDFQTELTFEFVRNFEIELLSWKGD